MCVESEKIDAVFDTMYKLLILCSKLKQLRWNEILQVSKTNEK